MTVRGGGIPRLSKASMPPLRMGPPPRSSPPMRMRASWFGSQRPTGYKVAARDPRAPTASSPRTVIPTTTSVPSCSGLSRRGLETAEREERSERRPALTAHGARRRPPTCGSGRRNGIPSRTKKLGWRKCKMENAVK